MTLRINLTPEQEALIAAEAQASGLPVEEYAIEKIFNGSSSLVKGNGNGKSKMSNESDIELDRLESWIKSISDPNHPGLPHEALSREAMYAGRGEICRDPDCQQCGGTQ